MAADKYAGLAAAVDAVAAADESWMFVFCAADEDGDPLLLLDEESIDTALVLTLMRSAQDRVLVMGTVEDEGDGLVFRSERFEHADFDSVLRGALAEHAPGLASARADDELDDIDWDDEDDLDEDENLDEDEDENLDEDEDEDLDEDDAVPAPAITATPAPAAPAAPAVPAVPADALPGTLSLVGTAQVVFVYCGADASGDPALEVAEGKVSPKVVMNLMRSAKDRALVMGRIERHPNGTTLIFRANRTDHPSMLEHLHSPLAERAPALQGALVLGEQDPIPEVGTATPPETDDDGVPDDPGEWLASAMAADTQTTAALEAWQSAQDALVAARRAETTVRADLADPEEGFDRELERLTERPDVKWARELVVRTRELIAATPPVTAASVQVREAALAAEQARQTLTQTVEARAAADENLGMAWGLAQVSGVELGWSSPVDVPPEASGASGGGDVTALLAVMDRVRKQAKEFKLRAKSKALEEMIPESPDATGALGVDEAGRDAVLDQAKKTLEALADTHKQLRHWHQWASSMPAEQAAMVRANTDAMVALIETHAAILRSLA